MKNIIKKIEIIIETIIGILILISPTLLVLLVIELNYGNEHITTCEVKDKWIKGTGEDNQKYLVSCGDNVYQITDLSFKGKFNSSDLYSKIEKGKTYQLTTTGYRIGFFSQYENINKIEECNIIIDNGVNFSDINY